MLVVQGESMVYLQVPRECKFILILWTCIFCDCHNTCSSKLTKTQFSWQSKSFEEVGAAWRNPFKFQMQKKSSVKSLSKYYLRNYLPSAYHIKTLDASRSTTDPFSRVWEYYSSLQWAMDVCHPKYCSKDGFPPVLYKLFLSA